MMVRMSNVYLTYVFCMFMEVLSTSCRNDPISHRRTLQIGPELADPSSGLCTVHISIYH